jgi:hypothetical protein
MEYWNDGMMRKELLQVTGCRFLDRLQIKHFSVAVPVFTGAMF